MSDVNAVITLNTRATKAISKVTSDLTKIVADLDVVTGKNAFMAEEIEAKQSVMDQIDGEYSDKLRKAKAELQLNILEDEDDVLENLLGDRDLAKISTDELDTMAKQLASAKLDNVTEVKEAVGQALGNAKRQHESELTTLNAQQSVETATLKAKIDSLESKVVFLEQSNRSQNAMLDAERQARVDMSKNAQQTVIQVPAGK